MDWQNRTLLIAQPDNEDRQAAVDAFVEAGAAVATVETGDEAKGTFVINPPDLVLVDLTLQDDQGITLCRELRQLSDVPVLMLADLERQDLIFKSLAAGADDYVARPFVPGELLIRSWAALQRVEALREAAEHTVYDDGHLMVDLANQQVTIDDEPIKVTGTEFALLAYLVKKAGQICTFEELLFSVWGPDYQEHSQYIHVFIWHLRQKLERDPKDPRYLISVHSVGYRFQERAPRPE